MTRLPLLTAAAIVVFPAVLATAGPIHAATTAGSEPIAAYASVLRTINPKLQIGESRAYAREVLANARRTKLDPRMIMAIVTVESHWKKDALSRVGARGLGQLMPNTAAELGVDPRNPNQNLAGTSSYLRFLLDRFRSAADPARFAIGAYNAGPNAVSRANGIPHIAETQTYVKRVLRVWENLNSRIARVFTLPRSEPVKKLASAARTADGAYWHLDAPTPLKAAPEAAVPVATPDPSAGDQL
jgi:soluble lytic murein transglycosylase-like protein